MSNNALALGTFDGLHLGHQRVLAAAAKGNCAPVAVTFAEPPRAVLNGQSHCCLLLPEQKKALLAQQGVQTCFLNFNKVMNTPAEQFLTFLLQEFQPVRLVCGFNYRFGRGAAGNPKLLQQFCSVNNIECTVVNAVEQGGVLVSSTQIRGLIAKGELPAANRLLGREFSYSGTVWHGAARGRRLGFPTVNLYYPDALVLPAFGVYAGHATVEGTIYNAVTNLGHRPTFESSKIISETYIFGFNGNAYGKNITVTLTDYIRPEQKFSGEAALRDAVEQDKKTAQRLLGKI